MDNEPIKVTDRVRVDLCEGMLIVPLGSIGKVVEKHPDFPDTWLVEFDSDPRHRWWFDSSELTVLPLD